MLRHILKSASIILGATIFSTILGYIFKIIIAQKDIELYGLYSLTYSIILFLVPIVVLGLNIGILKYSAHYKGKNNKDRENIAISTSLKIVSIFSIMVSLIIFFFSNFISSFFKLDISHSLKLFSPLVFILSISALFFSILISNKKIKELALSKNIIQSLLELLILITILFFALNISGIALALILSNLIMLALVYYFSKNSFKIQRGFDKSLVIFSLSTAFIFIIADLLTKIDTIILGHFVNLREIAMYNVAMPTAQTLILISIALLSVFLPTISEKHSKNQSIKTEYKKTFHWILLLTIPLAVLLIVFSKKVIEIFFGTNYYLASIPLSILAATLLVFSLSRPSFNVLLMLNKTKTLIKISGLIIIIDIILNFILIPISIKYCQNGIYGASIATGISFIILSILTMKYAKKYTKISLFDKTTFKIALSGILASIPLIIIKSIVKNQNLLEIIIYLILFGIIYISCLFVLKCFDEEDKKIYLAIKGKRKVGVEPTS